MSSCAEKISKIPQFVITRRYIKEELKEVSESFEEALKFDSVFVDDLFVQDEKWINGNIKILDNKSLQGVQDVVGDITVPKLDETGTVNGYYNKVDDPNSPKSFSDEGFNYVPFVLERYIKIEDYSEQEAENKSIPTNITKRSPNLFGVVNIDSWETFLESISDITAGKKITDFWKSWKFGIRISVIPTGDVFSGRTFEELASVVSNQECQESKSLQDWREKCATFSFNFSRRRAGRCRYQHLRLLS